MTATLPRVPGSPTDELLLGHLRRHVDEEQEILDAYTSVAERAPEHVRYLINLIVDDEERHHRVLQEMANRLDEDISYESAGPAVPHVLFGTVDREQLVADTERFLAIEKQDLNGLKQFAKVLTRERFGGLFPLLVELMELDTKKHIAILDYIAKTTAHPDR